jgi:hypothetical protein
MTRAALLLFRFRIDAQVLDAKSRDRALQMRRRTFFFGSIQRSITLSQEPRWAIEFLPRFVVLIRAAVVDGMASDVGSR